MFGCHLLDENAENQSHGSFSRVVALYININFLDERSAIVFQTMKKDPGI